MISNEEKNNFIIYKQSEERNFFRYVLIVEYIGSSFSGSQKQPGKKTIQSELESALSVLTKFNVNTIFSGRTDRGVNAKGQVVHFDMPYQIDMHRFLYSLNALLPDEISVSTINEVDKEFHSQKSALYRWYRYTINNKSQRSVWLKNAIHLQKKLNIEEMNKALSYLLGVHDFSSFKSSSSKNPAFECNMYFAKCKMEAGVIYIDLIANRFLYNMVRIIVGTLINIGKGEFSSEYMLKVLNYRDRTKAGPTARPEGLTFMSVNYGKKYSIFENKEAIYNENIFSKAS